MAQREPQAFDVIPCLADRGDERSVLCEDYLIGVPLPLGARLDGKNFSPPRFRDGADLSPCGARTLPWPRPLPLMEQSRIVLQVLKHNPLVCFPSVVFGLVFVRIDGRL